MKTVKKICAAVTAFAITASCSVYAASGLADVTDSKYEKAISVITGIGVMENYNETSFGTELNMTRAEFADVLYDIYTYRDKLEEAETAADDTQGQAQINTSGFSSGSLWGDDTGNTSGGGVFGGQTSSETKKSETRFTDVADTHWAYEAVETACVRGAMRGTSETSFEPDRAILFEEAVAAVVSLTGYGIKAELEGYPNGYITQAKTLKLLRNVTYVKGTNIKRGEVAQLLYNSLPMEILHFEITGQTHSYTTVKGETVLSELLGLKKIEETVNETDITSIVGDSSLAEGRIRIGKEIFTMGKNASDAGEYLGRKVIVYATDTDDTSKILYIEPSDDDRSIVINAEDIESFENNILTYLDNDRTKTVKVTANIPIIYNGMSVSELEGNPFDIQYGTVIIAKTDDDINAILIRSYESLAVKVSDKTNKKIFCQNDKIIDFNNEDIRYIIRYENGNEITSDSIAAGNTLAYSQNEKEVIIYVANKTADGSLTKISEDTITVSGTEYKMSEELMASSIMNGLKPGVSIKLYIDYFGGVAWYDITHRTYSPAILVNFAEEYDAENNTEQMIIKLVDLSSDEKPEGKKLVLAEKAKVEAADGATRNLTTENADVNLKKGFIKYSVNAEGELDRIQIPLDKEGEKGRTYTVFENSNQYYSSKNYFGGIYGVDLKTKLVQVPKDSRDINDYSYLNVTNIANANYNVSVYQRGGDIAAEVMLISDGTFTQTAMLNSTTFYAAEKIDFEYDEKAEKTVKRVWTTDANSKRISFISYLDYTDDSGNECTAFDICSGLSGDKKYEIEVGDIFFPTIKDNVTGEVSSVTILYKIDLEDPSGEKGYITADITDKYFVKNKYVDYQTGKHTIYENNLKADDVLNNGNPYATNAGTLPHVASNYYTIFYGYMLEADMTPSGQGDDQATWCTLFTTQDIRNSAYIPSGLPTVREYDPSGEYTGIYLKRYINFRGTSKIVFTYNGTEKNFDITRGGWLPKEWARPYSTYGAACSKIISLPTICIIINDGREK